MAGLPPQEQMVPMAVPVGGWSQGGGGNVPVATGMSPSQYAGLFQPSGTSGPGGSIKGPGFEICGRDSQIIMFMLKPGEEIMMEPGAMVHANGELTVKTSVGECGQALHRACCAGESMFRLHYLNESSVPQSVSATPVTPSKIIPVDLRQYSGIVVAKGAYFCAKGSDLRIGSKMVSSIAAMLGAGNIILTTLDGSGMCFISGAGTIIQKHLVPGESHIIDNAAFLCCSPSVQISAKRAGSLATMCAGGQGLVNTELIGPGMIMYQSMSAEKVAKFLMPGQPQ